MEGHCLLKGQQVRTMLRACTAFSSALRSPASYLGRLQVLRVPALSTMAARTGGDRSKFRFTVDTMNRRVLQMEYAVRGRTLIEAEEIEKAMKRGEPKPFNRVLYCNIGDCHAMGQTPLTFVRQLVAACADPDTLLHSGTYPSDVRERARAILEDCGGRSVGSYSDSRGISIIRKHVAEFISHRDGIPCDWEQVYLVSGASDGIKTLLFACMGQERQSGVIIPIPQYPLYTASIAEFNAYPINYYLDEGQHWAIDVEGLRKEVRAAREHCEPRVMVVINPGNPTGQYLPPENMKEIIKFCHEEGLVLFADEVYQENVYVAGAKFHSFRKVVRSMGPAYEDFQLASFNSTSKGFLGECGIRGGYMELMGMDSKVMAQLYKLCSARLCSTTLGQVVTDAMVKTPQPGDPSYEVFNKERSNVLQALARKARMVYECMNQIPEVYCNEVQGAMYAFPRVEIPEEAWADAKKESPNMELDMYYCLEFLRQKGVCVVPGSGFGQKPGTWHFRTTILPPEKDLIDMLKRFADFHCNFLRKYGRLTELHA